MRACPKASYGVGWADWFKLQSVSVSVSVLVLVLGSAAVLPFRDECKRFRAPGEHARGWAIRYAWCFDEPRCRVLVTTLDTRQLLSGKAGWEGKGGF